MKMFVDPGAIYLHRDVVDFRKSINGLMVKKWTRVVGQQVVEVKEFWLKLK
jgi:hypothetical protein